MPRARNIKPGFFTNEVLATLPALTRLLFVGLWTLADREGRLEDRPGKIKLQVLPSDDVDVDAALAELATAGFIERYVVEGARYIQVVKFTQHQTPHVRESASVIPPPHMPVTDQTPAHDLGNAEPGAEHRQDRLNTDSGYLIADSPVSTAAPPFLGKKQASADARARTRGADRAANVNGRKPALRSALAQVCYGRAPPELTPDERVWLDTAAAELATLADVNAERVAILGAHWQVIWPHLPPPTPRGLVANWSLLSADLDRRQRDTGSHETLDRQTATAAALAELDAGLAGDDGQPGGIPPARR